MLKKINSGQTTVDVDKKAFVADLESWFAIHKRDLPWRKTQDPYKIWISEVMLQQTQVNRVKDQFYLPFLERFPDVQTLSEATWEDVFPFWDGLGFYRRGKNLLRTAKRICSHFNGEFPRDATILASLPGIGAYTSAAIMAFSWNVKLPAVDTNLERLIKAIFPHEHVKKVAGELVKLSRGGRVFNAAMMDAMSFLRKEKTIGEPLQKYLHDDVITRLFPPRTAVKKKKKSRKHIIHVGVACIHKDGKYLIQTRPEGKSFAGMWEFPGGKKEKNEDMRGCVKREIVEELGMVVSVRPAFVTVTHEFDRVILKLHFHRCQIQSGTPVPQEKQEIKWVSTSQFDDVGFLETNNAALEKLKKMRT